MVISKTLQYAAHVKTLTTNRQQQPINNVNSVKCVSVFVTRCALKNNTWVYSTCKDYAITLWVSSLLSGMDTSSTFAPCPCRHLKRNNLMNRCATTAENIR